MVYVVADIHGEYDLFMKLLQKINFSKNDEMIICGDIIDKGRDSVKLLKFIKSKPNFRCVIGNHEYDFLKYYWSIMREKPKLSEALKALQEYFPYDGNLLDFATIDWLESLPYFIETRDFICVHAGVLLDENKKIVAFEKTPKEQFVYDRQFKEPSVKTNSEKCVFFGHTPTSYISNQAKIIKYKREEFNTNSIKDFYKIHLDLGVWLNGVLGCFCVNTCKEYYVDKLGYY